MCPESDWHPITLAKAAPSTLARTKGGAELQNSSVYCISTPCDFFPDAHTRCLSRVPRYVF